MEYLAADGQLLGHLLLQEPAEEPIIPVGGVVALIDPIAAAAVGRPIAEAFLYPERKVGATDGRITELHLWAVREGLRRAPAATFFEDFCQRLVAAGVPLWRAFVGMRTLHPQWAGYTYTWWRDRDVVHPARPERGEAYDQDLRDSPYTYLRDATNARDLPLRLRRRLAGSGAQRDFPVLEQLAIAGATDYFAD